MRGRSSIVAAPCLLVATASAFAQIAVPSVSKISPPALVLKGDIEKMQIPGTAPVSPPSSLPIVGASPGGTSAIDPRCARLTATQRKETPGCQ